MSINIYLYKQKEKLTENTIRKKWYYNKDKIISFSARVTVS